jgi:hypothetical protein
MPWFQKNIKYQTIQCVLGWSVIAKVYSGFTQVNGIRRFFLNYLHNFSRSQNITIIHV